MPFTTGGGYERRASGCRRTGKNPMSAAVAPLRADYLHNNEADHPPGLAWRSEGPCDRPAFTYRRHVAQDTDAAGAGPPGTPSMPDTCR